MSGKTMSEATPFSCVVVPLMQREPVAGTPGARALVVSLYRRELAEAGFRVTPKGLRLRA